MQQHRHHGDMVIFYASEDLGNVFFFFFFHGDDREYFHWVSRYKLIVHSSAGIRIFSIRISVLKDPLWPACLI